MPLAARGVCAIPCLTVESRARGESHLAGRERILRRATAAALLLFVVLSLVLTYPLALHLTDAVEDRQDALLNVWITAWDGHQLLSDPLDLFDANIFYPYPRTLAYSELLLGNGLLSLPITAATGNPVLGYNVALLLSFVLSGFGTYLLVLSLTRSPGAGMVAGTIFSFSAYRMTNLAQAQLLTTQWMPFALLALLQLVRSPRVRHVVTFVLLFCLQALSSFYYAILLAMAVAGLVAWQLAVRLWLRVRAGVQDGFHLRRVLLYLLLAAVLCVLIVLPFALPYFQVQRDLGFERSLADNEPFSASLRQYLMVPSGSVVHGWWLPSDDTPIAGGYAVDALFPGLIALALSVWGLVRGRGAVRWFFLLLAAVSLVLSFGPRLYLAPGQPAGLEIGLPYAWLYAVVPGFKALRAPVRFDALVMLSLAVLAGYGLAALGGKSLKDRAKPQGRSAPILLGMGVLLLVGLVVVESLVWPAAKAEPVPVGGEVPRVYRWLADHGTEPVLELPMAFTPGGPQLDYQYLSTYHWRATPDGYSGFVPPKHGQIVYEMTRFPSERALSLLQALGVRHLVIHTDRFAASRWQEMEQALSGMVDLELVESFGGDRVYEVAPRVSDPDDLELSVYFPPTAAAGQPYAAYVIVLNQGARSFAIRPTDVSEPTIAWQEEESTVTAGVPLVISPEGGAAVISLPMMAPVTPGRHRVTVRDQDGPLGAWSFTGEVEVGQAGDSAFPVPIRLEAWEVADAAHPGDSLPVALTWRALNKIDAYYSLYVKLVDGEGKAVAGWDGQPRNGEAPTLLWVPGEVIEDSVTLDVPGDLPAGEYMLEVGMYRAADLARCLTLDQDGSPLSRVMLGAVRVAE